MAACAKQQKSCKVCVRKPWRNNWQALTYFFNCTQIWNIKHRKLTLNCDKQAEAGRFSRRPAHHPAGGRLWGVWPLTLGHCCPGPAVHWKGQWSPTGTSSPLAPLCPTSPGCTHAPWLPGCPLQVPDPRVGHPSCDVAMQWNEWWLRGLCSDSYLGLCCFQWALNQPGGTTGKPSKAVHQAVPLGSNDLVWLEEVSAFSIPLLIFNFPSASPRRQFPVFSTMCLCCVVPFIYQTYAKKFHVKAFTFSHLQLLVSLCSARKHVFTIGDYKHDSLVQGNLETKLSSDSLEQLELSHIVKHAICYQVTCDVIKWGCQ